MNAEVISSAITAAGTLVLAVATFVSTRSANRAARLAERSLLAGIRPVLMGARIDDPPQKVGFADDKWVHLEGPMAAFDIGDDAVYLVIPVRNVGSGLAVLQSWDPLPERLTGEDAQGHHDPKTFRRQSRSIYIAPGDVGFWQGAFRDREDPLYDAFAKAGKDRMPVMIDVLYSDMHGGQQSITRFTVLPANDGRWMSTAGRHWILDGPSPR
jgi:hypothetical protein